MLLALGMLIVGTTLLTPKAALRDPDICLYLGTLVSAKERISTKKAIRRVAISAKVAIHGGAPLLQGGQGAGGGALLDELALPPFSSSSPDVVSSSSAV